MRRTIWECCTHQVIDHGGGWYAACTLTWKDYRKVRGRRAALCLAAEMALEDARENVEWFESIIIDEGAELDTYLRGLEHRRKGLFTPPPEAEA